MRQGQWKSWGDGSRKDQRSLVATMAVVNGADDGIGPTRNSQCHSDGVEVMTESRQWQS